MSVSFLAAGVGTAVAAVVTRAGGAVRPPAPAGPAAWACAAVGLTVALAAQALGYHRRLQPGGVPGRCEVGARLVAALGPALGAGRADGAKTFAVRFAARLAAGRADHHRRGDPGLRPPQRGGVHQGLAHRRRPLPVHPERASWCSRSRRHRDRADRAWSWPACGPGATRPGGPAARGGGGRAAACAGRPADPGGCRLKLPVNVGLRRLCRSPPRSPGSRASVAPGAGSRPAPGAPQARDDTGWGRHTARATACTPHRGDRGASPRHRLRRLYRPDTGGFGGDQRHRWLPARTGIRAGRRGTGYGQQRQRLPGHGSDYRPTASTRTDTPTSRPGGQPPAADGPTPRRRLARYDPKSRRTVRHLAVRWTVRRGSRPAARPGQTAAAGRRAETRPAVRPDRDLHAARRPGGGVRPAHPGGGRAVRAQEPDTLAYIVHAVPSAPMQRILYEVYRDRAAYEEHRQQPYISQFEEDRRPTCSRPT